MKMKKRTGSTALAAAMVLTAGLLFAESAPGPAVGRALTFEECLEIGLENNRLLRVSALGVDIARAQLGQVLSSYWPQVNLRSSLTQMDEPANFLFPAEVSTFLIETSLFPGQEPMQMASTVTVPEKNVKLMDPMTLTASVGLLYPLYTGGFRRALERQARSGVEIAVQERRRSELTLVYDLKRTYYGGVLARKLYAIGQEALARLEVLLALTEGLYEEGSGRVKKTDWLKSRVIVESVRSVVAHFGSNAETASRALALMIGWEQDVPIIPSEDAIPFEPETADADSLIGLSYAFNPDWGKVKAALSALEGKISEAKSGRLPKIAVTGNLMHLANGYEAGIMSPQNKNSWVVGVGMELPLFNGFRTKHQVLEARLRLGQLEENQMLLSEGIAFQVRNALQVMSRTENQTRSAKEAMRAAEENLRLTESAYQVDLAETEDVVEAQIIESIMSAQHLRALYDYLVARASLDLIVGRGVENLMMGGHR